MSAEEVTKFLENYTRKETVFALKIRPSKRSGANPKAFSTESSQLIFLIINQRLNYQFNELKVWKMDRDIVPKRRTTMLTLEAIALLFACQTSDRRFQVFEKVANVVVNFGVGLRKVEFFLTYCDVEYKLELSYDSMWQIYERCPWSHSAKFLIIQRCYVEDYFSIIWIHEKCSSGHLCGHPCLNYFKDTLDENCARTTDFTASSCIGQCTVLVLFSSGTTFSHNLLHGPTVISPDGLQLPYAIDFKVNYLVQNGCLACPTLDVSVSNRVLRHFNEYIDNFIRVSFVDEDWEKMRSTDICPRARTNKQHTTLYDRVFSTLSNGIVIGNKKFDFLAFSSSQLRENSVWMFCSRDGITTTSIREFNGMETNMFLSISAFQIRYGRYKGVVSIDPTSVMKLSLRKSMSKFKSSNIKLDVLSWSKKLLLCGYKPNDEPFLSMMLQTFRGLKLLELRNRARIFVPHARTLMGCLDETRTLEYGQVFVQLNEYNYICQGKVVVAKNPCLHPGDVRVLQSVNVPSLHHMVDCVVFPQKGFRFVLRQMGPELIPPRQVSTMDYSPAPNALLDHDVNIEEIHVYFTNYIVNNSLGKIANAHTAFADKEPEKAESQACVELAKLFSIAVDFPKTGVPADCVIEKLFREVKDIPQTSCIRSFTREMAMQSYDPDREVDGFKNFLYDAQYYKGEYDFKLGNLMDYYEIETEAKILCGSIMKLKKSSNSRKYAVRSLKKEGKAWFEEKSSTSGTHEDDVYAKASAWYHVTYHPDYWGCYNEGMNRKHFLSFPWCIYDKLIYIKKMNSARVFQSTKEKLIYDKLQFT
ncbi:hypothetical protein AQUCO_01600051v1 [Aquilegia coerulea]|uniref:RNA-dependent RNA polymerase n=1 Tax=Aquilegia coerulea TaxID=218851 RepID=A0A2G5DQ03_AQUCA|nr:hypothetical protein AQUCO_01600051v1 [Aquilegia coerulea]